MDIALPQQHVDIGFMGVLAHGIPEKDDRMNSALGDARCNLGISAEWTAGQSLNRNAKFRNPPPGCACSYECKPLEPGLVGPNKLDQRILFAIVGNQRYGLGLAHSARLRVQTAAVWAGTRTSVDGAKSPQAAA